MAHFSVAAVLPPVLGGLLIGLAVAALWLLEGRSAGISGILGDVLQPDRWGRAEERWRLWFLAGVLVGGLALGRLAPAAFAFAAPRSPAVLAGAGLLVGFGTRLGGGCTSGHGLCGVSRTSKRSILATLVFMALGVASVYVARHLLGGVA